jgi:hypothetical protein
MSSRDRKLPGWLLPVGLGLVVVALVVVALARGPVALDPETPEGAVQEYLVAISEDRWDEAVEVIHDDWRKSCVGDDLRAFDPGDFSAQLGTSGDTFRADMFEEDFAVPETENETPPTIPEDAAMVEVTINHGGATGGWDEHTMFELVDEDGFWWLVGDPWPHFIWSCQDR